VGVADEIERLKRQRAEEARRREVEAAKSEEARRGKEAADKEAREMARQRREANLLAWAAPFIRQFGIKEILDDVRGNVWRCGSVTETVSSSGNRVQVYLIYEWEHRYTDEHRIDEETWEYNVRIGIANTWVGVVLDRDAGNLRIHTSHYRDTSGGRDETAVVLPLSTERDKVTAAMERFLAEDWLYRTSKGKTPKKLEEYDPDAVGGSKRQLGKFFRRRH